MKLRKWVKVVIVVLLVYSVITLFTRKEVVNETGKNYTCYGSKLFQICNGETYE